MVRITYALSCMSEFLLGGVDDELAVLLASHVVLDFSLARLPVFSPVANSGLMTVLRPS